MLAEGRTESLSTWSNFRTSFSIRAQSQNSNFLLLFSRWVIFDSFVTPWAVACQAPLSMNISRHEYWSGLSFPSPGIFLIQGSNLYLYRQADSLVLSYQESSEVENRLKQEIKYFISTKQKTLVRTCICYLDYLLQPNQPKSSNLKQQWLFIP